MPCNICLKYGRPDYVSSDIVLFECDSCVRIHRDKAVLALKDISHKADVMSERPNGVTKRDMDEIASIAHAAIQFNQDRSVEHENGVYLCGDFSTPEQEKNDDD